MNIEEKILKLIGTSLNGRDLSLKTQSYQNLIWVKIIYDQKWSVADFYNPEDELSPFIDYLMTKLINEVDYAR